MRVFLTLLIPAAMIVSAVILYFQSMKGNHHVMPDWTRAKIKKHINTILKELNCKYTWTSDKNGDNVKYDFQGGHFSILLESKIRFLHLLYMAVFDADADKIDVVRELCNRCNLNSESCRIVYTIDNDRHKIVVHIISMIKGDNSITSEFLSSIMIEMFSWQNSFARLYGKINDKSSDSGTYDAEKNKVMVAHNLELLHEQELRHQEISDNFKDDEDFRLNLETFLSKSLGINSFLPLRMSFTTNSSSSVSEVSADDIKTFNLASLIISNNKFIAETATVDLSYLDKSSDDVTQRRLAILLNKEDISSGKLYYRATVLTVPLSVSKDAPAGSSLTKTESVSVLLSHDLTSAKLHEDEFNYLWKEAEAKTKSCDFNGMTDDERLLSECFNFTSAFNLLRGKRLFNQRCYLESLTYLESAFSTMMKSFGKLVPETRNHFFNISYMIGFAYNELKQYDKAYYYLEILEPLHYVLYTEEYINCLVNNGDMRAMPLINNLLSVTIFPQKNDETDNYDYEAGNDNTDKRDLSGFINFLRRRKTYLLIEESNYDEAERMLKKMLNEPDNMDFAIGELKYLDRLKNK